MHEWKPPHRVSSSSVFSRMIHRVSGPKRRIVTGIAIASDPFGNVIRPICIFLNRENFGMRPSAFLTFKTALQDCTAYCTSFLQA